MGTLYFSVDSALLRELGERLIGKPHIALAELVKNSYDADATQVLIGLDPKTDTIEVNDDGHGMGFDEFKRFWMRIGTSHKGDQRVSRRLRRPLTGSKGVGRLSVQFLSERMKLQTVVKGSDEWLEASLDWASAIDAGELTKATVDYKLHRTTPPFESGTAVILSGLKHRWDERTLTSLAQEIWWLQPPFQSADPADLHSRFQISFASPFPNLESAFSQQLEAILRIWTARLVGKCRDGIVNLSVEFAGEKPIAHSYAISEFPHNRDFNPRGVAPGDLDRFNLKECDFEVRIFKLANRLPQGIIVEDARNYFREFGGVHVYDSGFHLPYYGVPENDWLNVEFDHAHRKSLSVLLPDSLQLPRGMNNLPTLGRVFGAININTAREKGLTMLITRDRLADTRAFKDMRCVVRYALDFYAVIETRRKLDELERVRPIEPTSAKLRNVEHVLDEFESQLPDDVFDELKKGIQGAVAASDADREYSQHQIALLAPLATAGISAVAYQHELKKQFATIEEISERLGKIRSGNAALDRNLHSLSEDLISWLTRARATNALFDSLADFENTKTGVRLKARAVLEDVRRQTAFLARNATVDLDDCDTDLMLPEGSHVEWTALFQNVFINAFNAMLDSETRILKITTRVRSKSRGILLQDTGTGVNLAKSEELFKPFVRRSRISAERRALGYGGTGLGLTIVRLIAERTHCTVEFTEPEEDFRTAFLLSWKE